MDTAAAHPQSASDSPARRPIMKNYERNVSNDTILGGGLIAIAIAWVVLAAIRGPAGMDANDSAAGYAAPSLSTRLPAGPPARTMALPANAQRAAVDKIS
jgi:hypothetical protein